MSLSVVSFHRENDDRVRTGGAPVHDASYRMYVLAMRRSVGATTRPDYRVLWYVNTVRGP